jgi:ABC-type multidrug transport system fused ATPase/permease subunit
LKALLRLVDRANIDGEILIDNIDISRVTLSNLRSHLSVINQQPVLFSGTLRYNLDPFNRYCDEQCWISLEDVQLKGMVNSHPLGLLLPVAESGTNFSAGQCQLICIARAILKKTKILLIDEATELLIQAIIADKFQDQTILTIAHRLNTVATCDRILVLDKGMIVTFDVPENILPHYE